MFPTTTVQYTIVTLNVYILLLSTRDGSCESLMTSSVPWLEQVSRQEVLARGCANKYRLSHLNPTENLENPQFSHSHNLNSLDSYKSTTKNRKNSQQSLTDDQSSYNPLVRQARSLKAVKIDQNPLKSSPSNQNLVKSTPSNQNLIKSSPSNQNLIKPSASNRKSSNTHKTSLKSSPNNQNLLKPSPSNQNPSKSSHNYKSTNHNLKTPQKNRLNSPKTSKNHSKSRRPRDTSLSTSYNTPHTSSPPPYTLDQLDHILVDHKHRLLYCYVPKVACTNWKRVLLVLTGRVALPSNNYNNANNINSYNNANNINSYNNASINSNTHKNDRNDNNSHNNDRNVNHYNDSNNNLNNKSNSNNNGSNNNDSPKNGSVKYVRNLASIPASDAHKEGALERLSSTRDEREVARMLNEYTAFLMVRHPFERLLSAFRNKLEGDMPSAKYFQARVGRQIIRSQRRHPTARDLSTGDNVTFREFVRYLIAAGVDNVTGGAGDAANEHWRSVDRLCLPCTLNYTYVGRYETFERDARAILAAVGAPQVEFPVTRSGRTADHMRRYYQQLSIEEIEQLYRMYESDFRLFGYNLEDILGYDIG